MENNSVANVAGIFIAFMAILVFFIGLGAIDGIRNQLNSTLSPDVKNDPLYSDINEDYGDLKDTFLNGINFVLVITVLFAFYSSFIYKSDLIGYVINFMGGIIISGAMIYIMSAIFNAYTTTATGLFDISLLPSWFFDNLSNILLMNIVAGTLSFIFVRREVV